MLSKTCDIYRLLYQEQALAREQSRINSRAERDEARRLKFLNARTRIIGIDTQALGQQCEEMRRKREEEKESDRQDSK